ncbi:mitochondrial pyruvate carrier 2-like [Ctenocephalides felis]|uniref:mitochondrial pyruvate carrier 2-like n=1 Tax=Ctenocephalides felis TaxID=7515 RepID=UPI000E6E1A2B|nr:mitochondrial pyruvate carrier 2-like [Ctenocephalides felis]XP_026470373.1 mitochondrial pyruvate carrier 2-like [Ctenocephalides felis]
MPLEKLQEFFNHPAGPRTIFFWAPLFKWGLVIAGLSDMSRPAHQISTFQSGSLALTGFVWARYSLVITPRNYSLFAVNMLVGITQGIQFSRAMSYHPPTNNI